MNNSIFYFTTILTSLLGLSTLIYQIYLARKAIIADHERRKKQATLEYVRAISPKYRKLRTSLESIYGTDVLTNANVEELRKNREGKAQVRMMLASLEHLAVGINSGVFDEDLVYRMSGSHMINIYDKFKSYIKSIQNENRNAYEEFEYLARKFEGRKKLKPLPDGNIQHS